MTPRRTFLMGGLLAAGILLTSSCAGTRVPATPGAGGGGRMTALNSLAALNAVLAAPAGRSIVIFHSPRCDFCRATLRSVERVLPELSSDAVVYTVDIDSQPLIRDTLGIGPVPVVVFLRDGAEVKRWNVYRPAFLVRRALVRFFAS